MSLAPIAMDVYLRTGFHHKPRGAGEVFAASPGIGVSRYGLEQPFHELAREIGEGAAPWICFLDEAVLLPEHGVRKLLRSLLRAGPKTVGLAPHLSALAGIHGAGAGQSAPGAVPGVAASLSQAPSWCVVVRRSALEASGVLDKDWESLEFALAHFSAWAKDEGLALLRIDGPEPQVHAQAWISQILLETGAQLARDYERFGAEYGKAAVSPQFRVEMVGQTTGLDALAPLNEDPETIQPRFSVLCPAYKSRFFEETVRSVLTQTYPHFEFVVVIDGPAQAEEDALVAILETFQDDGRLRYVCQENRGTGPTRAHLATLAKGDFIVSVDDDDWLAPDCLEVFAQAIGADPELQILRGGAQITGFVEHYLVPRPRMVIDGVPCDFFEVNQPWAIARSLVESLGGFEGDPALQEAGEDSDFFLKADRVGAATLIIDHPLYYRRLSSYNQTLTSAPGEFHAHIQTLNQRHTPDQWRYERADFAEQGRYLIQHSWYKSLGGAHTLQTVTRYFNFNTKGECSDVIIDLEVTALCNADCTFCPRENLGRSDRWLAMSHVETLARAIENEGGGRKVVLCGIGEPTLHPKIDEIVLQLRRAGAQVCMTNNGSRMSVELFTKLVESGLGELNFSVNAATAETRELVMRRKDFAKVRENILAVLAHRDAHYPQIDINVSFVYCPQNRHEVHDFVAMWRGTTVRRCWIHPVNNRANLLPEELGLIDPAPVAARYEGDDRVVVDLWEHGFQPEYPEVCTIAQTLMFITADGDMLLCALDHERKNVIGNLRDANALQLHLEKIARYRRGDFARFCHGCTYCPRTSEYARIVGTLAGV